MESPNRKKSVRFGNITVQEYPLMIGLNTACSFGAPIQIGWKPIRTRMFYLEDIKLKDIERESREEEQQQRRTNPKDLIIPAHHRCQMLFMAGYSLDDIVQVTLEVRAARKLREETLQNHGWDRFSKFIGRTGKLPKGLLSGASSTLRRVQTTMRTGGKISSTTANTLLKRTKSIPKGLLDTSVGRNLRTAISSPNQKSRRRSITKLTIHPKQKTHVASVA